MSTELPEQRLRRRLTPADPVADDPDPEPTAPPDSALARWLPDTPPDGPSGWLAAARADPGRAGAVGLAVVGVLAVLVTVFTLVRDKPPPVTAANLPPVQMVSSASATPSAAAGPVVVSVVGLVQKPGLVTLDAGARIADALTAAGGPLDGADLVGLNMARRLTDGEQVVVGIAAPPGRPTTMGSSVTGGSTGASTASATPAAGHGPAGPVDLNTATVEQLDALPGVGPVTAAAIVAWRDTHGRFGSVDQLGEVDGIGPARLEKLRPLVRV
ncbi:ComEA family DNA-binding protein [Mycolicibacterium brisbanense]|uniref:Competence protein ComEA helix-hairpin-helix region n=1 Tax=Mycolicibacterium brisbanense TaxID=146020 RepID=A0A124DZ29_9MYCO|nr:ComEA family DNA-binding protein [Mycolicibacterium brisbanense]MCV7156993.1 ComEA family DNA-binding protein [Mycolicibacterium brisbanense]GAS86074.1 competence protein ComEA helix-hairpin-helix region [Mycolicibacterium brisbanense]